MKETADKYIDPFTDFGFKKIFGEEANKDLLIDFLNGLLESQEGKIVDLTYLVIEIDRKAIFNLCCENEKGDKFIVEMQKSKHNFFKSPSVFYASFPIQEQGKNNLWNYELKIVYPIDILDFIFDDHKDDKNLLHIVELKDQKCKFFYLELPKFKKEIHELETNFDKWLYVFTHLSELQKCPEKIENSIFIKLFKIAEIAKLTPKEKSAYEKSLKYYRDIKNVIDTSKQEGIIEFEKRGEKREEKRGIIKVAIQFKKNGVPIDIISKSTGLIEEEIENL